MFKMHTATGTCCIVAVLVGLAIDPLLGLLTIAVLAAATRRYSKP